MQSRNRRSWTKYQIHFLYLHRIIIHTRKIHFLYLHRIIIQTRKREQLLKVLTKHVQARKVTVTERNFRVSPKEINLIDENHQELKNLKPHQRFLNLLSCVENPLHEAFSQKMTFHDDQCSMMTNVHLCYIYTLCCYCPNLSEIYMTLSPVSGVDMTF